MTAANEDVVNTESETLLSSPNPSGELADTGSTETEEEESLDGDPHPSYSSLTDNGNASNPGNVNHASVVEAVHRVVQEVR